jgi:N-acetylmuramoyl-L-alanine amidase
MALDFELAESSWLCMRPNSKHHSAAHVVVLALALLGLDSALPSQRAYSDTSLVGKAVFIDPGHSGMSDASISRQVPNGRGGTKDCQTTGTSTNGGYAEHSFNWDVALRIRDALSGLGVRTQLSRFSDSELGPCVDQRAADANAMQPDAIVSIHADGGPPDGQGFHVLFSAPPLNEVQAGASMEFAGTMRDALVRDGLREANYIGRRGLMGRSDLAGLNHYAYPGVLVELGNMRNLEDAKRMEAPEGRAVYARAVADGIVEYLRQDSAPK